jgi:RNA polymerase sigma-70 factor, ECF subfamily
MPTLELDTVVQVLLRNRLRIAASAAVIGRDAHAADDTYQQIVLLALEQAGQFQSPEHVLNWAIRAARHRALDAIRKKPVYTLPDEILDMLERPDDRDSEEHAEAVSEALHGCMAGLGEPARKLLQMKYDEGLSGPAIAQRTHRTVDAVYQTLSRTHRALRQCVERKLAAQTREIER